MPTGLEGRSGLLCTGGDSACAGRAQHSTVAQRSRFHPAPSACLQTRVLPEIENPPSSKHAMLKRRTAPVALGFFVHTVTRLARTGRAFIGLTALSVSLCAVALLAKARAAGHRK